MNKQLWIDAAQIFDTWRVVPRVILLGYAWWLVYAVDMLLNWYINLPAASQTTQASSFCFGAVTAISGIGTYVYKIYSDASTDWSGQQRTTTTATATQTTTT